MKLTIITNINKTIWNPKPYFQYEKILLIKINIITNIDKTILNPGGGGKNKIPIFPPKYYNSKFLRPGGRAFSKQNFTNMKTKVLISRQISKFLYQVSGGEGRRPGGRWKKIKKYYYNNNTNSLMMMMLFFPFPPKEILSFLVLQKYCKL